MNRKGFLKSLGALFVLPNLAEKAKAAKNPTPIPIQKPVSTFTSEIYAVSGCFSGTVLTGIYNSSGYIYPPPMED